MCIAIPMRLMAVEGTDGLVEVDGISRKVNLMLIESPRVGDYVIVHAGCAISTVDETSAMETIDMLKTIFDLER